MEDWKYYQKLVLAELERLNSNIESLNDKAARNEKEIAVMKVRSGVWGSISGMIAAIIAFVIDAYFRKP